MSDGTMVSTFQCRGVWVQSLGMELRFHFVAKNFFKRVSWMECVAISIIDAIWSPYSFSCPADCPGLYCTVKITSSVIKGFLVNRYYLTIIRTR